MIQGIGPVVRHLDGVPGSTHGNNGCSSCLSRKGHGAAADLNAHNAFVARRIYRLAGDLEILSSLCCRMLLVLRDGQVDCFFLAGNGHFIGLIAHHDLCGAAGQFPGECHIVIIGIGRIYDLCLFQDNIVLCYGGEPAIIQHGQVIIVFLVFPVVKILVESAGAVIVPVLCSTVRRIHKLYLVAILTAGAGVIGREILPLSVNDL